MESHEFSKLPKNTPALQMILRERENRRARFEKIAARKIANGSWKREQLREKWVANLTRMYKVKKWRVKEGPKGSQDPMPRGAPNPWAMYRGFVDRAPDKKYKSPWERKKYPKGASRLEKGTLFIQKVERAKKAGKEAGARQTREWIRQLDQTITKATGARRLQLEKQKARLERGLA